MLSYRVTIQRTDSQGSLARCKAAEIACDTSIAGRSDAFNPAELLLGALAACMIKGIERATPILNFRHEGVEIRLEGVRQDSPPKLTGVTYEIIVDTAETDHRLDLLHRNVRKYGTIYNTIAGALALDGTIRRGMPAAASRS